MDAAHLSVETNLCRVVQNHALREVDLTNGTVTTLAGNGNKGNDYRGGGKGRAQVRMIFQDLVRVVADICADGPRSCTEVFVLS